MAFFQRVIQPSIPQTFVGKAAEAIDGAFASAQRRAMADGRVLTSQFAYARGTDRYFAMQAAVMQAALETGGEEVISRAAGFPMPLVRHGQFLIATCITDSLKHLQRSRARRLLASLNSGYEPQQLDLLDDVVVADDEMRFAMLLVAKPPMGVDQSLPAGVFFGVPTSSLRSWHFYQELGAMSALYDVGAVDAPALVGKKAPKLRQVARSQEDETGAGPSEG
jgi:hypothetical protein